MKIIIIGSGMSGLTAGAYLARAGHNVMIFEQFPTPGGVTATVHQDGFGWDIGPLLLEGFAPGDKGRIILEELGVSEQVPSVHEDRGLAMPEFALWKPKEYEGPYWRRERLKNLFPEESNALDRYYRFYDRMIRVMSLARQGETDRGLAALALKLRMLLAFQAVRKYVNWNGGQLMDHLPSRHSSWGSWLTLSPLRANSRPWAYPPSIWRQPSTSEYQLIRERRVPKRLTPTSLAAARPW